MSVHTFLRSIWPYAGTNYTLFCYSQEKNIKKHYWVQPHNKEQIDTYITRSRDHKQNLFMAMASFSQQKRTKQNAEFFRCLFIDLDIGPAPKPYANQTDALAALVVFCEACKFPKPTWIVNSGSGIHCYWVGDVDLTIQQWQPIASQLRDLCLAHDLYIDPVVTVDAARILRVPTSLHCKDTNNPKEVTILLHTKEHTWGELLAAIPAPTVLPVPPEFITTPSTMTVPLGQVTQTPKSFGQIIRQSVSGQGCAFLLHAVKFNRSLSEPEWRGALSIAKFCTDIDDAVVAVSADHADYSVIKTQEKLNSITGPYRCDTIQQLAARPEDCLNCIHYKKITSPIVLGTVIAPKDTANNHQEKTTTSETSEQDEYKEHPLGIILRSEPAHLNVAATPYPYVHGSDGYTYKILQLAEIKEAAKQGRTLYSGPQGESMARVYRGIINLVGRAYDATVGEEMAQIVVSRGQDENRFTKIAMCDIGGRDTLRKAVKQGAILNDAESNVVRDYLAHAIIADKAQARAVRAVNNGGWSNDLASFVYGRWAIHNNQQISNVIPLTNMDNITRVLQVRGSTQHWVNMAEYWNKPRHNAMAFTLLTAFGAPIMRLLDMGTVGSLIHLFSPESGIGKSAVQNMICAAYGNPRLMIMTPQDTINSIMSLIGTYCNTPVCIDEITNHPAEEISKLVYQFSQGREKNRMDSHMQIRATSGDWNTIVVSSGNASLIDKLCSIKAAPEGELMRFLELRPEPLDPNDALHSVMAGIHDNYGSVGVKYLWNIVNNQNIVQEEIRYVKQYIQENSSMGQSHRFWAALCTANIVGGRLAKRLGFINYDMDALLNWVLATVDNLIVSLETRILHGVNLFGNILSALAGHTITIPKQGIPIIPIKEPLALVDMTTCKISINVSTLNKIATTQQISVADVTTRLRDFKYRFVGQTVNNITASVAHALPPMTIPVYEYIFES